MKITPSELTKSGYELYAQLQHSDIAAFIQPYIFRKNFASIFYWTFNALVLALSLYKIFTCEIGIGESFGKFALGFCVLIPLIPIHELIHGLFYKLDGAAKVQYKANFRKFIFYAMSDQYVINFYSFVILAIAPFVIINTLLIIGSITTSGGWHFLFAGALFMHTAGCAGDFALISYFLENDSKRLVTYDDISLGMSYFYKKGNNS
ncbi:MAG: DUF3267 domain-containing protein [Bacteroidota bacterium]